MEKINLTLSSQTYNLIVQAVQELPWRLANPIFQEIDPQIRAALAKEATPVALSVDKAEEPVVE